MNSKLFKIVVAVLLVTSTRCICWSQDLPAKALLKRVDVKRLMGSAKTPEDLTTLASYFDQRASMFDRKAAEEDAELERLNEATFRSKNHPILVDRARMSGEHDRAEEKKCSNAASAFRLRAAALRDGIPTLDKPSTSAMN